MNDVIDNIMAGIDTYVRFPGDGEFWGWHDDHRDWDGTPEYKPAIQQVRSEFVWMLRQIYNRNLVGGVCLQLGMGPNGFASHGLWRRVFRHVVTIDLAVVAIDEMRYPGLSSHSVEAMRHADLFAPFDFLFIDAGHTYTDVSTDFTNYAAMVRRGGLITFHDALPRPKYPQVEIHKFIAHLPVTVFGDEVGTAVMEVT